MYTRLIWRAQNNIVLGVKERVLRLSLIKLEPEYGKVQTFLCQPGSDHQNTQLWKFFLCDWYAGSYLDVWDKGKSGVGEELPKKNLSALRLYLKILSSAVRMTSTWERKVWLMQILPLRGMLQEFYLLISKYDNRPLITGYSNLPPPRLTVYHNTPTRFFFFFLFLMIGKIFLPRIDVRGLHRHCLICTVILLSLVTRRSSARLCSAPSESVNIASRLPPPPVWPRCAILWWWFWQPRSPSLCHRWISPPSANTLLGEYKFKCLKTFGIVAPGYDIWVSR